MTTGKLNVVSIATADAAFRRVKPLLDQLRDNTKEAASVVAKEYGPLPKLEKAAFAEKVKAEYGWSQERLKTFAQIGREFPDKQALISRSSTSAKIDDLDPGHMQQIIQIDNGLLKKAAKQGMFDRPVSVSQIKHLRKTGQVPRPPTKPHPKTDIQKIKSLLVDAEQHMKRASLNIGEITAIMYDADISDAKGREATALIQAFEKLCTKMATANPVTSKRAFAILRGET